MMQQCKSLVIVLLLSLSLSASVRAETEATEDADQDAKMAWWREAKFGMFVHWGVYSVTGGQYKGRELPNSAEWMMNRGKIPIAEYEQYAAQFNPTKFDADEFVKRAKNAGMKYLVITAKHHDGFGLFDSKASSFDMVDSTPSKRDIMKELARACRDHGLRFGFYYSQAQDWHHPGGHGNNWDKTIERVSTDEYVRDKAAPEVKQLLTEYGPIAIFWWDTPRKMSQESFDLLHSLTSLQPGVITNDRLGDDYKGDHKTFERKIPKRGPTDADWEVCMPISGSWGYKKIDRSFKSKETLIHNLVDIVSKGGNYLLNVSPTGEGALLPEATERLEAIGEWMKVNSESIYGTSASPFEKLEWGRCTKKVYAKGADLYLHVFEWPEDGKLLVPGLKNEILQAYTMAGWESLATASTDAGTVVSLPSEPTDQYCSVLVLKVRGKLDIESSRPAPGADGALVLAADDAYLHNNEGSKDAEVRQHGETPHIGYWLDDKAWAEWGFRVDQPGVYQVWAEASVEGARTKFQVGLPDNKIDAEFASTGSYGVYQRRLLGELRIASAGDHALQVVPTPGGWEPMNLRKVELIFKAEK